MVTENTFVAKRYLIKKHPISYFNLAKEYLYKISDRHNNLLCIGCYQLRFVTKNL